MSQILCTICRQSDTCDKFLAQLCGHVFCDTCTFHFSNRERKCPLCRREWGSIAPFRIYLTFPDPEKSLSILRHLGDIDENSPAILVEKASGVVKRFVEDPDMPVAHDSAMLLLDAARRLEERVTPLATKLDVLQHENEALCHQVQVLEAQLKSKDVLAADLERLNQTIMEREVTITMIRDDLSHEKQKRQSERNTNRRLTRSLRKKQEEITVKEKEIDGLKSELVERDKELGLMKTKLRALAKPAKPPKTPAQSPDDSLIIEHTRPFSEIENVGNVTRPDKTVPGSSSRPLSAIFSLPRRKKVEL